jgi:hypothetical protein
MTRIQPLLRSMTLTRTFLASFSSPVLAGLVVRLLRLARAVRLVALLLILGHVIAVLNHELAALTFCTVSNL